MGKEASKRGTPESCECRAVWPNGPLSTATWAVPSLTRVGSRRHDSSRITLLPFSGKEGVLGLSRLSSTCWIGMFGIPQRSASVSLGGPGVPLHMDSASYWPTHPGGPAPAYCTLKFPSPSLFFPLLQCHPCLDFFPPCSVFLSIMHTQLLCHMEATAHWACASVSTLSTCKQPCY